MTEDLFLSDKVWYLIGIGLIILDLVVGLDFFVLSFGVGAAITGLVIGTSGEMGFLGIIQIETWIGALFLFSISSLVVLVPLKFLMYYRYKDKRDINDY
jgi:hypothetical protein